MIIDRILDRKDGFGYNARKFYFACLARGEVGDDITTAMDYGTESDVKRALCDYIDNNEYNPEIKKFINAVKWL
jgi:hypothetical protein